jgi:hypothetical protein
MGEVLLRHPLIHLYLLYVAALILAHLWAAFFGPARQGEGRESDSNPQGGSPSLSAGRLGRRGPGGQDPLEGRGDDGRCQGTETGAA